MPPKGGATVRMYRIGHGDCFLIAFDGETANQPVYVLIDCGYKPGSPAKIVRPAPKDVDDVVAHLRAATGGAIDVAIITHEHQDHVNGISQKRFAGITIKQSWFAWTEDPNDDVANALRKKFKDKLVGLAAARLHLAAAGNTEEAEAIDNFLEFELGGETPEEVATAFQGLAAADGSVLPNKKSMKVFKDLAEDGVKFIRPHETIYTLPGAKNVRVFAMGPPRQESQLLDVDPQGQEEFHLAASAYFGSAFLGEKQPPFDQRYRIPAESAFADSEYGPFFSDHYGKLNTPTNPSPTSQKTTSLNEVDGNADWRRIDDTWVLSALQLAIDVNNATNNSSLVLAFELGKGGKVLLFAGDAQRGNWISWAEKDWADGTDKVTAKELLGRAVLYKVGHHGSHNATLNGGAGDPYPNIGWMGLGKHADEFTAMITAVRAWALTQKGWNHPLKAIKEVLLKKCSGRVFQTDADIDKMPLTSADVPTKATGELPPNWNLFQKRVSGDTLYFDLRIEP
jgi:beta-lactamase superfamily II metal-dependent hydrolase